MRSRVHRREAQTADTQSRIRLTGAGPTGASASTLIRLQKLVGNAAVNRLLDHVQEAQTADMEPRTRLAGAGPTGPSASTLRRLQKLVGNSAVNRVPNPVPRRAFTFATVQRFCGSAEHHFQVDPQVSAHESVGGNEEDVHQDENEDYEEKETSDEHFRAPFGSSGASAPQSSSTSNPLWRPTASSSGDNPLSSPPKSSWGYTNPLWSPTATSSGDNPLWNEPQSQGTKFVSAQALLKERRRREKLLEKQRFVEETIAQLGDIRATERRPSPADPHKLLEATQGGSLKELKSYLDQWKAFYEDSVRQQRFEQVKLVNLDKRVRSRLEPIADQAERQGLIYERFFPAPSSSSTAPSEKGQEHQLLGVVGEEDFLHAACTWEKETDDNQQSYLYIHELASAPWNIWYTETYSDERARSGSGTLVIKQMARKSRELGCGGRLRLNAWGSSTGFYKKLGFVDYKALKKGQVTAGVELTPEAANRLLSK